LLTVFVLQRMHVVQLPTREIVESALFIVNYAPAKNTWVGHAWSLSVEEQFYLFWPLILTVCGPYRLRRIAVALILVVPVVRIATLLIFPPTHYLVDRMWMLAHTRIDMLMFGCALALFWPSERFRRLARQFTVRGGVPLSLFVLFVVCPLCSLIWPENFMSVAGYTMSGMAVATCIFHFVENPESGLGRLLNLRLVAHLGVISYSVYLWQQLFLNEKNSTISGHLPWSLLCTIVIAEFSYWCVERPSLRLRDRLTNRRKRHPELERTPLAPVTRASLPTPVANG
jgi:peptidoglycan/LPS O-acetylase OafA/YrhL